MMNWFFIKFDTFPSFNKTHYYSSHTLQVKQQQLTKIANTMKV